MNRSIDEYRCRYQPPRDGSLAFDLVLPMDWGPVAVKQISVGPGSFSRVALFGPGRGAGSAEISIDVAPIHREVEPSDWLDLLLERGGESVARSETAAGPGGMTSIVTSKAIVEGTPLLSTSLAIKDGQRIFLLQGRSRAAQFPVFERIFDRACRSFLLLSPSKRVLSEPMAQFRRIRPTRFSFIFPASWSLEELDCASGEGVVLELMNRHGESELGRMTVLLISRKHEQDLRASVEQHVEDLRRAGLPVGPLAYSGAPVQRPGARSAMLTFSASANVDIGRSDLTLDVVGFEGAGSPYHGVVQSLGPARAFVPPLWAIHKRARTIVLDSLTIGDA